MLLKRFCDAPELAKQQADEEWCQFLRAQGDNCEPPGEPEYQQLLRLLEEEIASVKEEFAYAEKANEERAEIERDACLAPEGETWAMLLRQEASLDRSIDRKMRILMRLRKDLGDLPIAPGGQGDGMRLGDSEALLDSDKMPELSPGTEAAEDSKMKELCGNVTENKGSRSDNRGAGANGVEDKLGSARNAGMLCAPQRRGSPVGGSPTQIVVGKSGS